VHFPATHSASAGGGIGHGEHAGGVTVGRVPPVFPVDNPKGGAPSLPSFVGGFVGVGAGVGRARSTDTATFVGQHPHGDE
jgi:hypothetical protein